MAAKTSIYESVYYKKTKDVYNNRLNFESEDLLIEREQLKIKKVQ